MKSALQREIALDRIIHPNEKEDLLLADTAFQDRMALGIYNGILEYFRDKGLDVSE